MGKICEMTFSSSGVCSVFVIEIARQNTVDITIYHGMWQIKGKGGDRSCGIRAYPLELKNIIVSTGKRSA